MDSKEFRRKAQANVDSDESEETNDNRNKGQQKNLCKVIRINGITVDDFLKLRNITESEAKCLASAQSTAVVSNGSQSRVVESLEHRSGESEEISRVRSLDDPSELVYRAPLGISFAQNQLNTESPNSTNSAVISNGCSAPPNSSQVDFKSPKASGTEGGKIIRVNSDERNNVDYSFGNDKYPAKVFSVGADSSLEMEAGWTDGSSYPSEKTMNNIGRQIGSTSYGTCWNLRPNVNGTREDGEGPSGSQRREECDRQDSSSGNEGDLSDGEDYCIYTYKGNNDTAEASNSVRSRNPRNDQDLAAAGQPNSGRSSPEMDFLEMDFDPGPSCEQDTGDSDLASINEDIQNLTLDNVDSDPLLANDSCIGKVASRQQPEDAPVKQREQDISNNMEQRNIEAVASTSRSANCTSPGSQSMPSTSAGLRKWEATSLNRSIACPLRESYSYHNNSGDLISPGDNRETEAELWSDNSLSSIPDNSNFNTRKHNLNSTLYHRMMAKKLMLDDQSLFNQSGDTDSESESCNIRLDGSASIEKVMLWSEEQAMFKQVTQIGTSACGATSAINALLVLEVPFSLEVLVKGVATRLREPGTPLPRYLVSRSLAGATHRDVIRGLSLATNGAVVAKFFSFYPERNVSLSHWLQYWMTRGAVPIATLNLQNCGSGSNIPDAWHHQMIFGVGQAGIYMTNPLECLPEKLVMHQLVSPSILLIKRADVLAHWNPTTDLTPLTRLDQHWRKLNVLGQVVNMIRETMGERKQPVNSTIGASHIRIPASFQAGITLVMAADAGAAKELMECEQLPLL